MHASQQNGKYICSVLSLTLTAVEQGVILAVKVSLLFLALWLRLLPFGCLAGLEPVCIVV